MKVTTADLRKIYDMIGPFEANGYSYHVDNLGILNINPIEAVFEQAGTAPRGMLFEKGKHTAWVSVPLGEVKPAKKSVARAEMNFERARNLKLGDLSKYFEDDAVVAIIDGDE